MSSQRLREVLLQTDEEFRQLWEEHRELDCRLGELSRQVYRSTNEDLEKATLKKRKLRLKDRMEDIVRRHRAPAAAERAVSHPQARG